MEESVGNGIVEYFYPKPEDIRIGYECEFKATNFEPKEGEDEMWMPRVIKVGNYLPALTNLQFKWVRVPYLTREQIEAEGWERDWGVLHSHGFAMRKGVNILVYIPNQDSSWALNLKVEKGHKGGCILFDGECKCINDFRVIMKLLNIK